MAKYKEPKPEKPEENYLIIKIPMRVLGSSSITKMVSDLENRIKVELGRLDENKG